MSIQGHEDMTDHNLPSAQNANCPREYGDGAWFAFAVRQRPSLSAWRYLEVIQRLQAAML